MLLFYYSIIRLLYYRIIYYNITAAWAVDREFVYIEFGNWVKRSIRFQEMRLGAPLGSPWDAFGATLVSLWPSWDTCGVHMERLGPQGVHVGVPLGARPDLGTSRALKYCKYQQDLRFWNSRPEVTEVTEVTEVVSKTVARTPPPTHAGGQDDGTSKKNMCNYRRPTGKSFRVVPCVRACVRAVW